MQYWVEVLGLAIDFTSSNALPRILLRTGTDGLGSTASARALIDGTDGGNQALSALIVIRPASQATRAFLFGVSPTAPHVFLVASLALAAAAVGATLLPARRASRVDPIAALRE